jgi:hypothetical protein
VREREEGGVEGEGECARGRKGKEREKARAGEGGEVVRW